MFTQGELITILISLSETRNREESLRPGESFTRELQALREKVKRLVTESINNQPVKG